MKIQLTIQYLPKENPMIFRDLTSQAWAVEHETLVPLVDGGSTAAPAPHLRALNLDLRWNLPLQPRHPHCEFAPNTIYPSLPNFIHKSR